MPSIQNLVLTDRAATPVNHTFTPSDVKGGVGTVVESNGTRVGDRTFTVSGRASPVSNRWNAKLKLVSPVIGSQIENGITTTVVLRTSFATVDFSSPQILLCRNGRTSSACCRARSIRPRCS